MPSAPLSPSCWYAPLAKRPHHPVHSHFISRNPDIATAGFVLLFVLLFISGAVAEWIKAVAFEAMKLGNQEQRAGRHPAGRFGVRSTDGSK
ncbi:hypothetical protein HOLleu_42238 [Holothuria leucospilota]|uniref:Uncharacterized protein n=1 Tax=Holothuria leucospilota TaxID=206669 RepID=A0A9Q1BBP8_HOLLE|nr:hypothetical protein HOLleu_42238 [Holothuria leucospilota]